MDDIGGVQEFEGAEDLINEVLDVLGQKLLSGANHSTQVSLHKFTNEIDITKHFPKRRKKIVRQKDLRLTPPLECRRRQVDLGYSRAPGFS